MNTVYLPLATPDYVFEALEAAGVEYAVETREEAKIRELEAVIIELEAKTRELEEELSATRLAREAQYGRTEALEAKVLSLTSDLKAARRANDQQCERVERAEENATSWYDECANLNKKISELKEQLREARGKILSLEQKIMQLLP